MLNKRSKYFLSLVFRVKKKRRRSRLTPEPGMRRAWLMKWDYTHRLSLSSSRPPCVSGAMKTAPEMLSMLISQGDDRRGWMFSSFLALADWVDVCRSGRRYGSPLSSGSSKNTGAAAAAATVSSDRGEKKMSNSTHRQIPS